MSVNSRLFIYPPGQENRSKRGSIWFSALVVLAGLLLLRTYVVEPYKIQSGSMNNTLLEGDYLLVSKAAYGSPILKWHIPGYATPARGDVVIFRPPMAPQTMWVKRLIGLPGDTLEMKDRVLYLNGERHDEPYVVYSSEEAPISDPVFHWQKRHLLPDVDTTTYQPRRDTWGPLVVPHEHYFVMGDHRSHSYDSRHWGFIPRQLIRGEVFLVYYSFPPSETGGLSWIRDARTERIGLFVR